MALSDCPKCWDTPCGCGYSYRNYSKDRRIELAAAALGVNKKDLLLVVGDLMENACLSDQEQKR